MTAAWSHPAFAAVADLVRARTGLSFEPARRRDAEAGIRRAMGRVGVDEVSGYLDRLLAGHAAFDDLVSEITVGETYFFRDPAHFELIRTKVIPDVVRRLGAGHPVRAWSAGCATGEEAYSLALLLDEMAVPGHVLATDISRPALRKAREAAYRRWSLRGLDEGLVRRVFRKAGDRWVLDARLRRHVTFHVHNLAEGSRPSLPNGVVGMDLILCRNVLIYFDRATIERVARMLYDALADGGWLITGPSDPLLDALAPFELVVGHAGVFYTKRVGSAALPILSAIRCLDDRRAGLNGPPREPERVRASSAFPRTAETADPSGPAEVGREVADPLADARDALAAGDYDRALVLTHDAQDAPASAVHVRALANARGSGEAVLRAQAALTRHPLSPELHLLHAVLLLDLQRHADAEHALRRVLYLDRSLAIASWLLGSSLRAQGKLDAAWRAFRNARDLARAHAPEAELALADGSRAGAMAATAEAEMARIDAARSAAAEGAPEAGGIRTKRRAS